MVRIILVLVVFLSQQCYGFSQNLHELRVVLDFDLEDHKEITALEVVFEDHSETYLYSRDQLKSLPQNGFILDSLDISNPRFEIRWYSSSSTEILVSIKHDFNNKKILATSIKPPLTKRKIHLSSDIKIGQFPQDFIEKVNVYTREEPTGSIKLWQLLNPLKSRTIEIRDQNYEYEYKVDWLLSPPYNNVYGKWSKTDKMALTIYPRFSITKFFVEYSKNGLENFKNIETKILYSFNGIYHEQTKHLEQGVLVEFHIPVFNNVLQAEIEVSYLKIVNDSIERMKKSISGNNFCYLELK